MELCKNSGGQLHQIATKLGKSSRDLVATDPTWILDDAFYRDHGGPILEEECHAGMLAQLPSEAVVKTYEQAMRGLATLRTSSLFKLAKEDQRREMVDVTSHLRSMRSGGNADMNLSSPSSFWVSLQNRLVWFYKFEMVPSHTGVLAKFKSKELRGPLALQQARDQLRRDVGRVDHGAWKC